MLNRLLRARRAMFIGAMVFALLVALVTLGVRSTARDANAGRMVSAPPSSERAPLQPEPPADTWTSLTPEMRKAIDERMSDSTSAASPLVEEELVEEKLAEENLGARGYMTRLPPRYRPVIVGRIENGQIVVGEVMNPPRDSKPDDHATK